MTMQGNTLSDQERRRCVAKIVEALTGQIERGELTLESAGHFGGG